MDTSKLPKHVAIILDGNRRWAEKNGIERKNGAWYGVAKAIEIVFSWTIQFEHDYGVKPCDQLTFYVMSTNNLLRRTDDEIKEGMKAFTEGVKEVRKNNLAVQRKIKVKFGGDMSMVDPKFAEQAMLMERETSVPNPKYSVNMAIAYDGNKELEQAYAKSYEQKLCLQQCMYFSDALPIDLMIRTGGEKRLSGFMLWYIGYAELRFIDSLAEDFSYKEFIGLLEQYCLTQRRFGQ